MFNALVVAVVQLVGSYFLAPFTTKGATAAIEAMKVADSPLAKALVLAISLGLVVWLIGLVIAVMLGGRYPLLGTLFMTLLFAVTPLLLIHFVPAAKEPIMSLAGRLSAVTRIPLNELHVVSLFAFVGYSLATLFRRG